MVFCVGRRQNIFRTILIGYENTKTVKSTMDSFNTKAIVQAFIFKTTKWHILLRYENEYNIATLRMRYEIIGQQQGLNSCSFECFMQVALYHEEKNRLPYSNAFFITNSTAPLSATLSVYAETSWFLTSLCVENEVFTIVWKHIKLLSIT